MAALLQIVVRDPDRQVGNKPTPVGGVAVQAGPPGDGAGSDLDPALELGLPVRTVGAGAFEVELAEGKELVVRLLREGFHPLQVSLRIGANLGFVHRQPLIMRLAHAGVEEREGKKVRRALLTVDWHAPAQELVMASGRDAMFHPSAARRQGWLLDRGRAHRGCVLTQLRYESEPRADPPTFELTIETLLVGAVRHRPCVMTRQVVTAEEEKSVFAVYQALARIGRERPGSVLEVGFLNHAYWIGPVLLNTVRRGYGCYGACPIHGGRHKNTLCPVPRQVVEHTRWLGEPAPDPSEPAVNVGVILRELTFELADSERWSNFPAHDLGHQRSFDRANGQNGQPRDLALLDRDPRNTDFCHPGMLLQAGPVGPPRLVSLDAMRAALHEDATLRVWGCSNGSMGGLWRAAVQEARRLDARGQRSPNRLLRLRAFHEHGGESDLHTWEVRRRDFELCWLSNLRRSYAQGLAVALGRPCFAAVPGTWAWFKDAHQTGALTIHAGVARAMKPAARELAGLGDPDEGGFYRFEPDYHVRARGQRHRVRLTVLLTGFAPFGATDRPEFPKTNGAAEAVKRVIPLNIEWGADVPPWIELELKLVKQPAVDVVWTCPAARSPHPDLVPKAGRPPFEVKGSEGISKLAQEVDADLVVIVGESGAMARTAAGGVQHARLELFARNLGRGFDAASPVVDNDGFALDATGPIFPGEPEVLRTTIPLRGWALAQSALKNVRALRVEEFASRDPIASAGDFVCNESYYRLLLDARETGRWVCMIHVPATERWERVGDEKRWVVEDPLSPVRDDVARALEVAVRSFVEHMLWGTEVYGRLENEAARARLAALQAAGVRP